MFDSVRNRFLLAAGVAVFTATAFTALFSRSIRVEEKRGQDAVAVWKARVGVDLAALPRLHPPHPDSEEARALDVLLQPIDLWLCGRSADRGSGAGSEFDSDVLGELRESLRAAMRSGNTEPPAFSPAVVSYIERQAGTLDAVADYVAKHRDIRWREDFAPRPRSSLLYTADHLTMHRLLIGRAFLALGREDTATAVRMLSTSQHLNRVLAERRELESQLIATGVERLQLALLRRAGSALGVAPAAPASGIRERYVAGMSAEAAVVLANAQRSPFSEDVDEPGESVIRVLAGPKLQFAANEAVTMAADAVEEIGRSPDGCLELAKKRRAPRGIFADAFQIFNATEAWRRFQILALDRAMTGALLTGRTSSPCPSVVITVRDEGSTRTVEAKGLPAQPENAIALPSVVTAQSDRRKQ